MIFLLTEHNFMAYPISCFEKWKQSIFSGLSCASVRDLFVYLITELIKKYGLLVSTSKEQYSGGI